MNLQPRIEADLMRLWEHLDGEEMMYVVQGIVGNTVVPVIQPPKEVEQTTAIVDHQEALISFFSSERGADALRKRLVKTLGYKDRELTVTAIPVNDISDLVRDLNYDFQDDFGIRLRAEAYYVRNGEVVIGDVIFSETIAKN